MKVPAEMRKLRIWLDFADVKWKSADSAERKVTNIFIGNYRLSVIFSEHTLGYKYGELEMIPPYEIDKIYPDYIGYLSAAEIICKIKEETE